MLSDAEIVCLCAAIYDPTFNEKEWDHFWPGDDFTDDICAGIKDNVMVFRGSITPHDWFRDLNAIPRDPLDHPQLGRIHSGFYEGMPNFYRGTIALLGDNPIIAGHSLGAARAWIYAAEHIISGNAVGKITVFGSPRPGCQQMKNLFNSTPRASYKNRLDPVTNVPIWLPDFPVVDMQDFTRLDEIPAFSDIGLFADHHIELYRQGVANITAGAIQSAHIKSL